ncbi:protein-L-isoaspartate O-methyltransferase family protein [Thiobacter aerophilum]|uniref:Protein-L-isoaspartate O-methyltransferase n=1 Tax=Thiobacter aerophilum TaxID=3121275 RepID=A0ABV0EFE7_9BURK
MDLEQARFNMVEQQIRPWGVLDETVLGTLYRVKREEYVPPVYRSLAFSDLEIPLGHGQTMLAPKLEARLLQALELKPTDKVLEVGTGSGYFTALLAQLARDVVSVEILPEFSSEARAKLAAHEIHNVTFEVGDAARGWARHAPYDAIVLTGSTPVLAEAFLHSLRPGGRLLAVVGEPPVMTARRVRLIEPGVSESEDLFETCIAPLINAPQPARFVF